MGEITAVWSLSAFVFAALAGFGFGVFILGGLARRMRRGAPDAETAGWVAGALAAWFVALLILSQTLAALADGDPLWPRILSRVGPYLVGSAAAGVGTWAALRWSRRKRKKEGP